MKNTTTKALISSVDRINRLTTLSIQLSALTDTLYGDGIESFTCKSTEVVDGVLWLVHDLAEQIRILVEQIETMREVAA